MMNIKVTGRHINVTDNIREYAQKKLEKLEAYFNQLIDCHIILYLEKLDRVVEVVINGDGVQFHGREKGETFFAAIDLLLEKMDRQIIKFKEKSQSHKGVRNEIPDSLIFESFDESINRNIRLNQVSNKPLNRIEAYLQMKNDRRDFMLFKQGVGEVDSEIDYSNKRYAALFRDTDMCRMVEISLDQASDGTEPGAFMEYVLDVKDESLSNPKIDFRKADG
jgi:putative sigma-54 modulation protein